MKKMLAALLGVAFLMSYTPDVKAQPVDYHMVIKGESLWLIAVKYQVGLSEIINANPEIKDPHWIYPEQTIKVPRILETTKNMEEQVRYLVNVARQKAGLKPLYMDWQLQRCARIKSEDMKSHNYFSHQSPTYGSPFDMMKKFGVTYSTAGENIARGQRLPKDVMDSWMNSHGHRANIMNPAFTHIGVGYYSGTWTQMFIGK
jgi:uncharacterized YkwD family protein/spore coat assembly protein SafA